MPSIGQRIKEVRKKLGLSQEEFGRIFDAGKSYISSVENDKSKLSVDNLVKLLVNYNVSMDYILGGLGSPFLTDSRKSTEAHFRTQVLDIMKEFGLIDCKAQ